MKNTITREEAGVLLDKYLKKDYLKYHSIETEAIMRALAKYFNENEDFWGITWLLHDLDMEEIWENWENHGKRTCEILRQEWYEIPEMFKAIYSHCECLGLPDAKRETRLEYCLSSWEQITGIITAYARMRTEWFKSMEISSLTKKFKDKAFAAKVNREIINDIEKVWLNRADFFRIAIEAIQKIEDKIKLK